MKAIYPYKTLSGALELVVSQVQIDDKLPGSDLHDTQFRLVSPYKLDREDWATITLDIQVEGPADELAMLDEQDRSPSVTAVAHCRPTNERKAVVLERSSMDPSRWTGKARLRRENFRGKVDFHAVLTASINGLPCRWMAETDGWTVYFDEPAVPPIEGTLRVQWAHFEGPEREQAVPENAKDESFYVALEQNPPIVFLNSDFAGLPDLLSDERTRPESEKALRDAEYRRIATAAWTEVFNVAVAAIKPGDEGEEPDWPDLDWQEQALRSVLPRVYPNMSLSEALAKAHEDFHGDGALTLQGLGQVAISQEINAGRSLRRSLDRMNRGDGA